MMQGNQKMELSLTLDEKHGRVGKRLLINRVRRFVDGYDGVTAQAFEVSALSDGRTRIEMRVEGSKGVLCLFRHAFCENFPLAKFHVLQRQN